MTGHNYRRYRFTKRTHRSQNLGPFVNHEMNRCIACYRCVRFYQDAAGGRDLDVFQWHNHVYFGRAKDGPLENELSGNLVEICPTGVFTDKTFKRHYARPWDLQTAPSVCVHCSLGCNTIPGERGGTLRRIRTRFHGEVNGYYLCDRGRFGYEFVNSERRVRKVKIRNKEVTGAEAAAYVKGLVSGGRVIGIGSPRASLESNYALRELVGVDHFYSGLAAKEYALSALVLDILQQGAARTASLREAACADAVLLLGEDVTQTAPLTAASLRQAVLTQPIEIATKLNIHRFHDAAVREALQKEKGPFFVVTPDATKLDDIATAVFRESPEETARFGFAIAQSVQGDAPPVADLPEKRRQTAGLIAETLRNAQRPLVVAGGGSGSPAVIQAAANVAWALCAAGVPAKLLLVLPECNSLGAALLGGGDLEAAAQAVRSGAAETVIVLENDLTRRAGTETVEAILAAPHLIVLDSISNATTTRAEVVLPAATFAETNGTLVNNEGRAQRFYQVFEPESEVRGSWQWLEEIGSGRKTFDEVVAAMVRAMPALAGVAEAAPGADFRVAGEKIPRQPHRFSGRTAVPGEASSEEKSVPVDPDTALAFSMEGYAGIPPAALVTRYWRPGWNSNQAINKFQQEVSGPPRGGDAGKRLFDAAGLREKPYYSAAPGPFERWAGELWVVAAWHVFGSEELSVLSPGVAELSPEPYLGLNPDDAAALGAKEGDLMELRIAGGPAQRLRARLRPALVAGVATVPAGLGELAAVELPAWGKAETIGRLEGGAA